MTEMDKTLSQRLTGLLTQDYKLKPSADGQWLNTGICPACGKKELYTHAQNPWVLRCGRETKCGETLSIRDLYPEEFGQFNKRFQPTADNPTATADAYLSVGRGLNLSRMKPFNYYTQEHWSHPSATRGTATIRFTIPGTNGSCMERFCDPVDVINEDGTRTTRKQNFKGSHAGWWWMPPDMMIKEGDEVWIVEAIIDAISLWQNEIKAVAILSCGNYPEKALANVPAAQVRWVWALDNDKAGKANTRKHVERMRDARLINIGAAQVPSNSKQDWNDLHRLEKLAPRHIDEYLYHGSLLIAENAKQKGGLIYEKTGATGFVVDHGNRLYWWKYDGMPDVPKDDALEYAKLTPIANAKPEFLYFQRNEITDESWFFCRVNFPDYRSPINLSFTPAQMTSASEFKKRLANAEGAWFSGAANHLDYIGSRWLSNLKKVNTIEYIGYSKEHKAFIFPNYAVKGGRAYPINDEEYFDLPKDSIKTLARDNSMQLQTSGKNYREDWAQLIWRAFGAKGIIACVYWFGSLYAEQIRKQQSSFPFLEIFGEPGSGKTTLLEFIWRIFGREDYEGIDPNKNTFAGNQRKMTQYSGIPTVFIEADREEDSHARRFDWEEVKPYYNGRGLRVRGMKNSGNDTYEPPFRGTLVIAQNEPVNASDAVLQRIVQLRFTKAVHSPDSRAAVAEMLKLDREHLSYFVMKACQQEQVVMDAFATHQPRFQQMLLEMEAVKESRLAKNHAQLMALAEAFGALAGLDAEQRRQVRDALINACIDRQQAIESDHPAVQEFWDIFDYLDPMGMDETNRPKSLLNHSQDPNLIAISLNEFIHWASEKRQQVPLLKDLKRHLKTSKARKFVGASQTVASGIHRGANGKSKSVRCWVFRVAA